jgi:hypothetical protein
MFSASCFNTGSILAWIDAALVIINSNLLLILIVAHNQHISSMLFLE